MNIGQITLKRDSLSDNVVSAMRIIIYFIQSPKVQGTPLDSPSDNFKHLQMKTLKIFSLFAFLCVAQLSFAQNTTESIPVSGNCGMCKSTIEKAAKKAGASSAEWDEEAKVLKVSYSNSTTDAAKIQQAVAGVGYDTRDFKASDKVYNKLPACCKYERAGTKQLSCCEGKCEMKDGKCTKSGDCKGSDCCKNGTCEKKS